MAEIQSSGKTARRALLGSSTFVVVLTTLLLTPAMAAGLAPSSVMRAPFARSWSVSSFQEGTSGAVQLDLLRLPVFQNTTGFVGFAARAVDSGCRGACTNVASAHGGLDIFIPLTPPSKATRVVIDFTVTVNASWSLLAGHCRYSPAYSFSCQEQASLGISSYLYIRDRTAGYYTYPSISPALYFQYAVGNFTGCSGSSCTQGGSSNVSGAFQSTYTTNATFNMRPMDPRHHYVLQLYLTWQVGVEQYATNTVMHGGHAVASLNMGRGPNGILVGPIHFH